MQSDPGFGGKGQEWKWFEYEGEKSNHVKDGGRSWGEERVLMISCFNEKELNSLYCLRGGKEARARAWLMLELLLLSNGAASHFPHSLPRYRTYPWPLREMKWMPSSPAFASPIKPSACFPKWLCLPSEGDTKFKPFFLAWMCFSPRNSRISREKHLGKPSVGYIWRITISESVSGYWGPNYLFYKEKNFIQSTQQTPSLARLANADTPGWERDRGHYGCLDQSWFTTSLSPVEFGSDE